MNREQLIHSATVDIDAGTIMSTNYDYRTMRYVQAIAKLLLAQTIPVDMAPDASASTRLCDFCAHPRHLCSCGPPAPRITDESEWLPGDPQ